MTHKEVPVCVIKQAIVELMSLDYVIPTLGTVLNSLSVTLATTLDPGYEYVLTQAESIKDVVTIQHGLAHLA